MKLIKRFSLIFFAVIILCAFVPIQAFAVDPVVFSEAETLGATIVDLYGAYNNTSLAYQEMTSSGALTEVITLYQNYSSNASDPYTLAAIGVAAAAAGAIAVIYDAVTGQGYVQLYQEQYISSMDGYWDYQLTDAGLVRDSISGLFSWTLDQNNQVLPALIYQISNSSINGIPLGSFGSNYSLDYYYNNDFRYSSVITISSTSSSPGGVFFIRSSNDPDVYSRYEIFQAASYQPWKFYEVRSNSTINDYDYNTSFNLGSLTYSGGGTFTINNNSYGGSQRNFDNGSIPIYIGDTSDLTSVFGAITNNTTIQSSTSSVSAEPSIYIGDPLQNPLEISIPDPAGTDYDPQPVRITTTIPWDPDWGNPFPDGVSTPEPGVPYSITDPEILNNAVPDIWNSIVADGVEIQDAPEPVNPGPTPSEVYVPFLPITLPSFDFSLSGIWHYVTAWVASLGAWFTMVFSIWAALPYAIVVPVYATAVIVIVLGVYKRFFM